MKEKLMALKTLGFKYITRDMDNRIFVWINKPQRLIICAKSKKEEMYRKYGKETILNYITFENEQEEDSIRYGSFVFSRIESRIDFWDYEHFQIRDPNNEFKDITWENSPFEIP